MVFQAHPGDILAGKYRVDRVLGIGGMGMVVAATHLELDQMVALKFMLGELATSPKLLDRFLREARAVAKLRGEHVCRIFDVGRLDNGSPYIVMELLQGEDFAAVLSREGKLEPHVAVTYMLQAIEGVAEAHAEGIVHRDLKPGNLFITTDRDGTPLVKVLDFGISKSSSAPATKTGDVMGSPGYMAPEQMSNAKATDARTDVWALGVILYQALSSNMPWTGESLPALCMSVISDPPPPLSETVPTGLRDAVMRCLAKEKEGRWANVGELAKAIAPFGDGDAATTATRITKIISARPTTTPPTGVTVVAPTLPEAGRNDQAATVAAKPQRHDVTPAPVRPISTMSSSAAELKLPVDKPRSKAPIAIGGAVIVVGGGLALALGMGGSNDDKRPEIAAAPPPVVTKPEPAAPVATPVVEDPLVVGKRASVRLGCMACHTASATHGTGPSFAGAWGSVVELANGSTAMYDENYVKESINTPLVKIRRGFGATHPTFTLSDAELEPLVVYIKSLANEPGPPIATVATPTTKPPAKPTGKPPVTPPKPPDVKPPPDKKPDEMWMQMTHDKDKK